MPRALEEINRRSVEREGAGAQGAHFFEGLLSETLVFRRASGQVVGKADFLEALRGTSPFSERRVDGEVEVRLLDDDHALVTLVVAAKRAAGGDWSRYRNVRLFTREDDRWRMDLWFNYALP